MGRAPKPHRPEFGSKGVAAVSEASPVILAEATVAAFAAVSLPLSEIDPLRANPGPGAPGRPQIAKTLRNADEQTVAMMHALLRAVDSRGWAERSFASWGVVGAPRYLGRMMIAGLLTRYFEDAKYSINPHVIPNFCLHSVSGTASVGLELHGPNLGVGGGSRNAGEGLMTGLSILAEGQLPGVWLLLCQSDPEPRPDRFGKPTNEITLYAAALALSSDEPAVGALKLLRRPPGSGGGSVRSLVNFLTGGSGEPWSCPIEGLGEIELNVAVGAANQRA